MALGPLTPDPYKVEWIRYNKIRSLSERWITSRKMQSLGTSALRIGISFLNTRQVSLETGCVLSQQIRLQSDLESDLE